MHVSALSNMPDSTPGNTRKHRETSEHVNKPWMASAAPEICLGYHASGIGRRPTHGPDDLLQRCWPASWLASSLPFLESGRKQIPSRGLAAQRGA
eukprot:9297783-Alexandrium_andersonii.AAC.1